MTGARIDLEPARFGRTGVHSYLGMHPECSFDQVQPLDAPMYLPRGSVQGAHVCDDGTVFASTSDLNWDRVRL